MSEKRRDFCFLTYLVVCDKVNLKTFFSLLLFSSSFSLLLFSSSFSLLLFSSFFSLLLFSFPLFIPSNKTFYTMYVRHKKSVGTQDADITNPFFFLHAVPMCVFFVFPISDPFWSLSFLVTSYSICNLLFFIPSQLFSPFQFLTFSCLHFRFNTIVWSPNLSIGISTIETYIHLRGKHSIHDSIILLLSSSSFSFKILEKIIFYLN